MPCVYACPQVCPAGTGADRQAGEETGAASASSIVPEAALQPLAPERSGGCGKIQLDLSEESVLLVRKRTSVMWEKKKKCKLSASEENTVSFYFFPP